MHQKGNVALGSSTRSRVQGIAEPMAEVLELIRGRRQELEAAAVARPMTPVPRSKSNFLRVILKRLLGVREAEDRVWTPTVKTGLAQHGWWSCWCRPRQLAFLSLALVSLACESSSGR